MIRKAAALFVLCVGTDVQVVDMYRAMQKPDGGKEARKVENNNLADIQGVLRYIHQEVIVEHAQGDPDRTKRKYGIDSIARYRVQVKNPSGIEAGAPVPGFGSMFSAFDFGVATNDDALKELAKVGDFVGIQLHSQDDASMVVAYPYYWFSLPGSCPNLPWKCIPGNKQTSCPTKRSDLEVMPPVCAESGCAGKKDDAAQKCAANFSQPDTMAGCCLRYSFKEEDVIKGGLCNNSEKPTGEPGCVYMYESLEDKDYVSLDSLSGITSAKCGVDGKRTCNDWTDWRINCYDPTKKYKKKFKKTDLGNGKIKVDVEETPYCVEYDLHPYCQDTPPDLCNSVDCQQLSPSEREIGLEYWLGRCEESQNTRRAEGINFAFTKTSSKNHLMVDKELLDSNFKCSAGGMRCTPNLDGGLYCTRQYGGVCTPCYIPGTKVPFPAANTTPTCPFNILAEGGYTPPAGTECKSQDAADICCLYKVNGPCSTSYSDGSSAELSVTGFMGVMAASLEDPDQMYKFAVHFIEDNGGKVENEDQLREEVYWLWRVHPPKRYEEEWEAFKESLKASTAANFGPGSGTTGEPLPEGESTTPKPGEKKHHAHWPVWIVVVVVGGAGFLAAAWFYVYRNPGQRQQRGSFVEEDQHRSLQMTRM